MMIEASDSVPLEMRAGVSLGMWLDARGVEAPPGRRGPRRKRKVAKSPLPASCHPPSSSVEGRDGGERGDASGFRGSSGLRTLDGRGPPSEPLSSGDGDLDDDDDEEEEDASSEEQGEMAREDQEVVPLQAKAPPPLLVQPLPSGSSASPASPALLPAAAAGVTGSVPKQALAPIQKGAWIDLEHLKALAKMKQQMQPR